MAVAAAAGRDGRHGEGDLHAAAEELGERVRGRVAAVPAAVRPGDAGAQSDAGKDESAQS